MIEKLGFGGGCHWCTEAVFLSLKGVSRVEQGWIAAEGAQGSFSEAVIVHFDRAIIDVLTLIAVHLHTHSSTADHQRREKYRSAVYVYDEAQSIHSRKALEILQAAFDKPIVTKLLPFRAFRPSEEVFRNYYYNNPAKPFCITYINPKLSLILKQFSKHADKEKIKSLNT